jgi:hypothetical protein
VNLGTKLSRRCATELRYGVARLPDGHRKRELTTTIRGILATRNTADFEETGIKLIDPWRLS